MVSESERVRGSASAVFSDKPVTTLESLYGSRHREAVERLKRVTEEGKIAAVLGPRRVGKTSVVKTFLEHYGYRYIYFDLSPHMWNKYVSARNIPSPDINFQKSDLPKEAKESYVLIRHWKHWKYWSMLKPTLVRPASKSFRENFLLLVDAVSKIYERFAVVFDEAHVLQYIRRLNHRNILQRIHESYRNVAIVLVSSAPGMLMKALSPKRGNDADLIRYVDRVYVPRWEKNEAVKYLSDGLEEAGVTYTEEELVAAYKELSGIPGFIAYYGRIRVAGADHPTALYVADRLATRDWAKELRSFLHAYSSPLYVYVLLTIADKEVGITPSGIVNELGRWLGIKVSMSELSNVLVKLQDAGMVERTGETYTIPDAVLRRTILIVLSRFYV